MRGEPVRGEGRKQMKEDIAGSNERGSRREERTRQGKEIGQTLQEERGTVEDTRQRKEEETRRRGKDK